MIISQNNHSNKLLCFVTIASVYFYVLSLRRGDFVVRVMRLRHEGYWVRFPCKPINFKAVLQEKVKGAQSSGLVKPWVPSTWFL